MTINEFVPGNRKEWKVRLIGVLGLAGILFWFGLVIFWPSRMSDDERALRVISETEQKDVEWDWALNYVSESMLRSDDPVRYNKAVETLNSRVRNLAYCGPNGCSGLTKGNVHPMVQDMMVVLATRRTPVSGEIARLDLMNLDLRGVDLSKETLASRAPDLRFTRLQNADLRHANLEKAKMIGTRLDGAILNGANLKEARLARAVLDGADLEDAKLQGSNLDGAYLNMVKGKGANFLEADVIGVAAQKGDFTNAVFKGSVLQRSEFREAKFIGANMEGADLSYADLEAADLTGTRMVGAHMAGSCLRKAILKETDLSKADVDAVNFEESQWVNARLTLLANWRTSKGLHNIKIQECIDPPPGFQEFVNTESRARNAEDEE